MKLLKTTQFLHKYIKFVENEKLRNTLNVFFATLIWKCFSLTDSFNALNLDTHIGEQQETKVFRKFLKLPACMKWD